MSHNQSRAEKTEGHLRRPGRSGNFGQNRGFAAGGKGGGAAAPSPALAPSAAQSPSSASHEFSTNRSYKKAVNGQGEQIRVNLGSSNSNEGHRSVSNGAHAITSSHGPSVGLESGSSKPADSLNYNKRIPRAVPKTPIEPAKSAVATPGDESGPFLQFGTINPGIMNGMQIPARTCSAPPNLDEQKRHQANHDSVRAGPAVPAPSAPKPQQSLQQPLPPKQQQQQTVKDVDVATQIGNKESHPPIRQNRDMHAPIASTPSATPIRSSVLTLGGMPMHVPVPVPFQQPQIPLQFRGPNLQMSSQGIAPSSLQMTVTLPSGNVSQVPQPMFVSNIQSHSLQPPAIMHQGQNLGFPPQLGHQLPQLGSMGVGLAPQFHQQQSANFVTQRKAVKITHPDTHEELKLDKRTDLHTDASASGLRQRPISTSQSQSLPPFNHQISYYPTAYNTSSMFYPSLSLNLSSTQRSTGPQSARYNYPIGQNGQTMPFINSASGSRPGPPLPLHGLSETVISEVSSVSASFAAPAQVTIKPAILSSSEKVGTQSVRISMPATKPESPKKFKLPVEVPVASHLKDKDVGPQNADTMQKKSYEPSVADPSSSTTDKSLTNVSSMHINKSESSSLAPISVGSGTSIVDEKFESIKEALGSDSLKNHQKLPSTWELKHSQQQILQEDSLESSGSMNLHPAETVISNNMEAIVGHSTSNDSASIHSAPEADSFTSVTGLHPMSRESTTSELDQKKDTVGALGSSGAELEEESFEAASSNNLDPVEAAADRVSFEGMEDLQISTPSTVVDGTVSGTFDISLNCYNNLEYGQKQHSLIELKCGSEPYGDLLDSTSPKSNAISMSIGSSDGVPVVVIMEVEKEADSHTFDSDDLQLDSRAEGESLDIAKAAVSNVPVTIFSNEKDAQPISSDKVSHTDADDHKISATDSSILKCEITCYENVAASDASNSLSEIPVLSDSEMKQKPEVKAVDLTTGETPSLLSVSFDKPSLQPNRPKTNKKKKKKENLSKADAAGSYDLYDAYKGPNEKLDMSCSSETSEVSSAANSNSNTVEVHDNVYVAVELDEQSKAEIEDWEDAADESTLKLRSDDGELIYEEKKVHVEYGNESSGKKKYSRDFLLTFYEHCRDLPEGFDVGSDITDILICAQAGMDTLPSPGRIIDRSLSASRGDRRMAGISEDDRRMKGSNAFRMDIGHSAAAMNFRPVQGVNHGVLRNPRLQSPNQLYGGILSGPTQSLASQGGIGRNNSDADRWQRATGTQRGLMPPPQGSMQVMHKSTNRYEVGKVSDEEEQKQRRLKAILNKLTPQNFEKLFTQVKEVNIDNTVTLTGVISQIFDKALMEPTFCEMYADFCHHLASDLPDFVEDNEKITFRRLLLNKCQEEFERGEREEAEAEKAEEEGECHQSEAERENNRIRTRRRMLGNIRLIGELYKKKMLTERIMHECIKKLLGQYQNPDEENIEALCKLMSTIGEMIDHSKSREHMDAYFDMMARLSTNQKLSSRVRFMLKDTIDLRKNRWQQRRKVEGPKKIEDVHRDAAQERQAQTSRTSSRGPIITSKRGPSVDYGHRGSTTLSSPSSHLSGSIRALPGQNRGPGSQDVRFVDDRSQFESRVLSVPLSQRHGVCGSITLGPQGGLAKGMSGRGQGLMSNVPLAEISPRVVDSQRLASGSNGSSLTHDRILSSSRDENIPKYMPDRSLGVTNDQTSFQDRNSLYGIRDSRHVDHSLDKFGVATSGRRPSSSGGKMSISEPKKLSEDVLREKSISAIREYYSAKDEKEVILCIRDLYTPSFYPSVVSLWVSDSFERRNIERSLLAELLVKLSKGHDCLISPSQLIEGFESVLMSLEEAVNDAPKAAEFLGEIFGKIIVENLVPLVDIGKLILQGGEVPGCLIEAGLGSEILGSILEFVKIEKGDSVLNEIRISSNLSFEDFRPPYASSKSKKLDGFLGR